MSQSLDWKNHSRQPATLYQHDGLLDLLLGSIFAVASIGMLLDESLLIILPPAIFIPIWMALKSKVTAPRLTDEEMREAASFDAARRNGVMLMLGLMLGALVLGVAVFAIGSGLTSALGEQVGRFLWPAVAIGIGVLVLSIPGFVYRLPRFFIYAACGLAIWVIGFWAGWAFPISLFAISLIMLTGGCSVFWDFLRTHPRN